MYARSYIRRIIVNYVANSDRSTRALLFGNYRKQKKRRERRISEPKSNFVSLQSLRKFMRFERSIVRNHRFLVPRSLNFPAKTVNARFNRWSWNEITYVTWIPLSPQISLRNSRRYGILKIREFQVKSVATLAYRKETQRTNSDRVARKIHSLLATTHLSPSSLFFFFSVCFLIFFIANIVTRRIIGSHSKSSALFRYSLSLSIFRSLVRYIPFFFFLVFSRIASAQCTHP